MSLHLRLHYPLSREKQAELGVLLWDGYGSFPLGDTQVSGEPAKLVFVKCGRVDFCTLERFTPACPPFARIFEKGMRQMRFVSWGGESALQCVHPGFCVVHPSGNCWGWGGSLVFAEITEFPDNWAGLESTCRARKESPLSWVAMSYFQEE